MARLSYWMGAKAGMGGGMAGLAPLDPSVVRHKY